MKRPPRFPLAIFHSHFQVKGKGNPEAWVAVVKPGRMLYEMEGVPEPVAREALRLAAHKLPLATRVVRREDA